MNYIKQLQEDNATKDAIINEYKEGLENIYRYLSLPKFQGFENSNVNVNDIFLRIREIEQNAITAEYQ